MKIKNISNKELSIPFKSKQGKGIILTLKPGQIVFCESHNDKNQQVRVFLRKNKIEISEDDKPQNGQYYHVYGVLPHEEVVKLMQHTAQTVDLDDEEDEISSSESISSDLVITESNEEEVDDIDDKKQDSQIKNKGGRPKGSKNKKKSGRPKKKKPIGRPSKNKSSQKSKEENINNDKI